MPFLEDQKSGSLEHAGSIAKVLIEKLEDDLVDCEVEPDKERDYDIARLGGLLPYENFTLDLYDNKGAIVACEGFPDCNLFIHGKTGTGKTHLAVALIRGVKSSSMIKPQRIMRIIRGSGDQNAEDEQQAINKIVRQRILAIDDLGANKDTEYSMSILYEILDGRLMNKATGLIVTSNLSLDELSLKMGDDRITSRIAGICRIIKLGGNDRRLGNGH